MPELSQEVIDRLKLATDLVIKSFTLHPIKEELFIEDAASGDNTKDQDPVDAGRLYLITSVSGVDEDNSPTLTKLGVSDGATDYWHKIKSAAVAGETVDFNGMLVLSEGDFIRATWTGVTVNDRLALYINGYWIEL